MAVSVEALPAETPDDVVAAARRRRQMGYVAFAAMAVLAVVLERQLAAVAPLLMPNPHRVPTSRKWA